PPAAGVVAPGAPAHAGGGAGPTAHHEPRPGQNPRPIGPARTEGAARSDRSADCHSGVRARPSLAETPEPGALVEARARTGSNPASAANSEAPSAISRGYRMRSSHRARRRSRSSLLKMFGTSFAATARNAQVPRQGPK